METLLKLSPALLQFLLLFFSSYLLLNRLLIGQFSSKPYLRSFWAWSLTCFVSATFYLFAALFIYRQISEVLLIADEDLALSLYASATAISMLFLVASGFFLHARLRRRLLAKHGIATSARVRSVVQQHTNLASVYLTNLSFTTAHKQIELSVCLSKRCKENEELRLRYLPERPDIIELDETALVVHY